MTEHDEQVAIFQWANTMMSRYPELRLLFAVPNGAKLPWRRNSKNQRYSPEAIRLTGEGLRRGVPDMCLPVARGGYHGAFFELKAGKNKPSLEQLWWVDTLTEQGYYAVVEWGAENMIRLIEDYLGERIVRHE